MVGPIGDNQDKSIEDAVQQFVHAQSRGEQPNVDEFVKQYPKLEPQLRQRIHNLEKIDVLFDSLVQANESDFEGEDTVIRDDLVGQKIGAFEIVKVIGRGGMGVVYLANDTKLGRSVAIKSMPADLAIAKTRFRREATLLASLNHPNIAVIHEIIEEKELGYLILEYVPGDTLAQRITRKPLKLQEVLSISRQVAEAVTAAHDKGIIHRDLKPGNIKITPDGRVKVLDFGLAKPTSEEDMSQDSAVTQAGSIIGTPAYMSPEQIRGDPIDRRTDIWSFGCVLYEMLTGKRPFEGKTVSDTIARTLERQPDWQALPLSTPANIRVLLRRCLEKDRERRLQHMGDASIEINETLNLSATATQVITPVKPRRMAMIIGAVIIIVLSAIAVWFILTKTDQPPSKEIRLVILPFENLGLAEDDYFTDGVTEEITSRLSAIHSLGVISRTSATQYKKSDKTIRQIGEELNVEYVLEGTVRWERLSEGPSQVRVTPQLIRVSDDTHLWSDRYDAVLANIFEVQSDIAEKVAEALDIALLEPERQVIESRPTENMEAHKYYLRGNDYFHRSYEEDDFRIAIQMYEKAVELDPTFALAYCRLSMAHSWVYWFYDRSDGRLTMAKRAVDKAFQLNPDLPEAYAALGRYYYNHLDFDRALEQFAIARKSLPNDSEILSLIGYAQRRQGKFEQALANIKRACELDPLSSNMSLQLASTFMLLRRYAEAESYYERSISLSPDQAFPYFWKAGVYLLWEGNTEKAWAVFEQVSQSIDSLDDPWIVLRSVVLNMFDGDYEKALGQLSSYKLEAFDNQFYFIPKAQICAQINGLMGNQQAEQANYESARSILESKIQQQPEDERFHSSLGIVFAGLGRKEDAIREGKRGVELLPVTKDAWRGLYRVEDLARIYVMVGEFDVAIDQLAFLLSRPGEMSIPLLRLDPVWDPLRNHPRFKMLVEIKR
ncbi:MAG: protein kinase domain-containing protein [Planctomycetota bacterium]|jgi:serine/threonine protein kinase/tetratricopeptide (TPR) repeat protein